MPRRERYRNGDPIALNGCDGCQPALINGVLCHEQGCPDAWRDHPAECIECGCHFYRTESRRQRTCPDCLHPHDED